MSGNNINDKIKDIKTRFSDALEEFIKAYPEPNYFKKFIFLWKTGKYDKLNLIFEFLFAPKWLIKRFFAEIKFQFEKNEHWQEPDN